MSEFRRRMMMAQRGGGSIPNYLCFTASEDNSTITRDGTYAANLEYSSNGNTWNTFDDTVNITLNTNDSVYFRGTNNRLATSVTNYTRFVMTGSIAASGNIMSLLQISGFDNVLTIPNQFCFCKLFYDCAALTTAPELPATTLTNSCYNQMFTGCNSLLETPLLPASQCLASCYSYMFANCTSLISAQILATSVYGNYACQSMLESTNVNYIKNLIISPNSTTLLNWVRYVPNITGSILVKHIDATWTTTGNSGVPTNWTIIYYDPAVDKYYTDQTRATECDDHGNPIQN